MADKLHSSRWWIALYVLAALITLGRIGAALSNPDHFWQGLIKLVPITGVQEMGFNIESVVEDALVFFAILSCCQTRVRFS